MAGDTRKTLSFENGLPQSSADQDHQGAEQSKTGEYDRSKLAGTPLAGMLTVPSHMVYGVRNVFHGFDERVIAKLQAVDFEYRNLLARRDTLKGFLKPGDLEAGVNNGVTRRWHELAEQIGVERKKILAAVHEILVEAFKEAFTFLIEHLDDHRLEEMKISVSQFAVAQILYDNMDYFEDYYALGKSVRLSVLEDVKVRATKLGENVLLNVMPSRNIEGKTDVLTELIAAGRRQPKYHESPRRVNTLPPPPFVPLSDAEIRAMAARDGVKLNPPAPLKKHSETIPYMGVIPDPHRPQAVTDAAVLTPEVQEVKANAEEMVKSIPPASAHALPNLSLLFVAPEVDEEVTAVDLQVQQVSALTAEEVTTTTLPIFAGSNGTEDQTGPELTIGVVELPELADAFEEEAMTTQRMPVAQKAHSESGFTSASSRTAEYAVEPHQPPKAKTATPRLPSIMLSQSLVPPAVVAPKVEVVEKAEEPTLPKIEIPASPYRESESTEKARAPQVEAPVPAKKESWFQRKAAAVSQKASEGWSWVKNKFQRYGKAAVLAGGMAAASGMAISADTVLHFQKDNSAVTPKDSDKTPEPAASQSPVASASASNSAGKVGAAPTAAPKTDAQQAAPNIESNKPESKARTTFAKVLTDSKSPLVQSIINKGEVKLGSNTVIDTMIDSFMGLATDEQKVQLHELQKEINLGLGTYFNEHFGTDAKIAESMKDPKLRNLYRTAKVAKQKGWFNSSHTKAENPQDYALVVEMLADASELGIDQSDNADPAVKAYVNGNMFQAKLPGNTVHLRKANGSYHVVQEMVLAIFDGQKVHDILDAKYGKSAKRTHAPAGQMHMQAPVQTPIQKIDTPKQDVQQPKTGGVYLPNIHLNRDFGGINNSGAMTAQDKFLAAIESGWDEPTEQDKLLTSLEDGWKEPTAQDKLLSEVEKGWTEVFDAADKLALEKTNLEKTRMVEFDLPLELTTRQETDAILPTVVEKVASMYPHADTAMVKKMIRQYGWIGIHLVSRGRGHFVVEINKNFYKNILSPILQKKVTSRLA